MPHTAPTPNLEGLLQLSRREGVDIRPALLRVLTDLYVQQPTHTREEDQQYMELTLRLLPVVDKPTRTAVASKLASYPSAPAAIIEHLAGDIAHVTKAIPAPTNPEPDSNDEDRADADGSPARADVMQQLLADAPGGDSGEPIQRAAALGETFLRAKAAERARLLADLDAAAPAAPDKNPRSYNPELVRRLEVSALQRNEREFAREVQQALRIAHDTALRIARDVSGEPLVVVALALAMPLAVLQRVLLFLNPMIGESVERVFALSRLYEQLSPGAASSIVTSWREESARRNGARYVGVHADEPGTHGAALMDNARRAVSGRSGEAARRPEPARPPGSSQRTT